MAAPFFTDRARPPTEAAILAALGRAGGAWQKLFARLGDEHPELRATWGYYADGKSWLLKVAGKKTVCWIAVERGGFRVAFYFAERLLDALAASDLSDERKAELAAGAPTGKLRRVAVTFGPQRGLDDVLTLVRLKLSLR